MLEIRDVSLPHTRQIKTHEPHIKLSASKGTTNMIRLTVMLDVGEWMQESTPYHVAFELMEFDKDHGSTSDLIQQAARVLMVDHHAPGYNHVGSSFRLQVVWAASPNEAYCGNYFPLRGTSILRDGDILVLKLVEQSEMEQMEAGQLPQQN